MNLERDSTDKIRADFQNWKRAVTAFLATLPPPRELSEEEELEIELFAARHRGYVKENTRSAKTAAGRAAWIVLILVYSAVLSIIGWGVIHLVLPALK